MEKNSLTQITDEAKPLDVITNRIDSVRSRILSVTMDIESVSNRLNGPDPKDSALDETATDKIHDSIILSGLDRLMTELEDIVCRLEIERNRLTKLL